MTLEIIDLKQKKRGAVRPGPRSETDGRPSPRPRTPPEPKRAEPPEIRHDPSLLASRVHEDLQRFVSFLSHEIRQPLNSLSLWTDLLGSTQDLDEKGREYLTHILRAVERLSRIVDEQRAFASVVSDPVETDWVELGEILETVEQELAEVLASGRARLEVGELPRVYTDPNLLRPVFRNLILNAVQHRRPEVEPEIRVWSREPQTASGLACEVLVEDNGPGFAAEDAERVFGLFERLEPERSDGTGLGLALCRRALERLGGTIRAESSPGQGATFILGLPDLRVEECPANEE